MPLHLFIEYTPASWDISCPQHSLLSLAYLTFLGNWNISLTAYARYAFVDRVCWSILKFFPGTIICNENQGLRITTDTPFAHMHMIARILWFS